MERGAPALLPADLHPDPTGDGARNICQPDAGGSRPAPTAALAHRLAKALAAFHKLNQHSVVGLE